LIEEEEYELNNLSYVAVPFYLDSIFKNEQLPERIRIITGDKTKSNEDHLTKLDDLCGTWINENQKQWKIVEKSLGGLVLVKEKKKPLQWEVRAEAFVPANKS